MCWCTLAVVYLFDDDSSQPCLLCQQSRWFYMQVQAGMSGTAHLHNYHYCVAVHLFVNIVLYRNKNCNNAETSHILLVSFPCFYTTRLYQQFLN